MKFQPIFKTNQLSKDTHLNTGVQIQRIESGDGEQSGILAALNVHLIQTLLSDGQFIPIKFQCWIVDAIELQANDWNFEWRPNSFAASKVSKTHSQFDKIAKHTCNKNLDQYSKQETIER